MAGPASAEACACFALGDRSSAAAIATVGRSQALTISGLSFEASKVVDWLTWLEQYVLEAPALTASCLRWEQIAVLPREVFATVAALAAYVVHSHRWKELVRNGQKPDLETTMHVFASDPLMDVFTAEGCYFVVLGEQKISLPYPARLFEMCRYERLLKRSHAILERVHAGRYDFAEALEVAEMKTTIELAMLSTLTTNFIEPLALNSAARFTRVAEPRFDRS